MVPTGNDPQEGHGLLSAVFLSYEGSVEAFGEKVAPHTRWVPLAAGATLDV
jgi:hypothetical protein